MELSYIKLDERLDQVHYAELRAPEAEQREFQRRFMMSWIYHELALEGVVMRESDLARALEGREGRDYCDSVLLERIRSFRETIRFVKRASVRRTRISPEFALEIQSRILGEGQKTPYRIEEGATEQYKHDVVDPGDIKTALGAVFAYVEANEFAMHPIALAVQLHYKFIRVWPFDQQSGAVARMLANYVLICHGYPPAIIHAQDRQAYYHSLHYDVSRLHELASDSIANQIMFRERLVGCFQHEMRIAG